MKPEAHHCDSQARAALIIVWLVGGMGVLALLGLLLLAYTKREPSTVVLTSLAGAVTGAMTGLPALLGRLSNQGTTNQTEITNSPDNPVPTTVEETTP